MTREQRLEKALNAVWAFATTMIDRHGMNGDDTLTDEDRKRWHDAAELASIALDNL